MFCYQCEQTVQGTGCAKFGACGKDPETSDLQDLLVHAAKAVARYGHRAGKLGARDGEVDHFVVDALFTTVTNVNFDPQRVADMIDQAAQVRDRARALYESACRDAGTEPETVGAPADWAPESTREGLVSQAAAIGVEQRIKDLGADVAGLVELLICGLKGTAAYAQHARILGREDDAVYAFFHQALDFVCDAQSIDDLLGMNLRCGEVNLQVMEMLDGANTGAYGTPEPTVVRVTPVKGKAILVSGHDLKDLGDLLEQTAGQDINVYTHGEMLPCHAYPGLKKHAHLVGNYGGAWQDQQDEFDAFPGAILMTTNCIQKPRDSYKDRIFTTGLVGWPGIYHIANGDFSPVIEAARQAGGFAEDGPEQTITVGFGHGAVLGLADTVVKAVKDGAIRHFFLVGGCDGAKSGRNYYTQFAEQVPDDCVILTLACGKYRFNKLDLGDIGGIPRLLDCGQCNDAYSAVRIASALAGAFECGVNDLPLSLVLSWYEQKAVCILLSLLHLGIRNIRLGPSLPAFVTPAALGVLVEKFNIMPITTPADDLAAILGPAQGN